MKTVAIAIGLSILFSIQTLAGWMQGGEGQWLYEEAGKIVKNDWVEVDGTWYYFEQNGFMVTNFVLVIEGVLYTFNENGKWIHTKIPDVVRDEPWIHENKAAGYSIEIPANVTLSSNGEVDNPVYTINNRDMIAELTHLSVTNEKKFQHRVEQYLSEVISVNPGYIAREQSKTKIGDFEFTVYKYSDKDKNKFLDVYTYYNQSKRCIFVINVWHDDSGHHHFHIDPMLRTLKKVT